MYRNEVSVLSEASIPLKNPLEPTGHVTYSAVENPLFKLLQDVRYQNPHAGLIAR